MQRNFNIEKDFILSDLQVFREYDLNNFVINAKSTLNQVNDNVAAIKLDTYNTMTIYLLVRVWIEVLEMKG